MTRAQVDLIRHIGKHVGPIHSTFQEILSDDLQIDVHHMKSSLFRRFEVVVTTGMSAKPISVPVDAKESRFAEVLVVLPKGLPVKKPAFDDERNYWPIRLLKTLARHVHHANTWFGFGHTPANGEPEADTKPYADGTQRCAVMLLPPASLGKAVWTLNRPNGEEVIFWSAVPLHVDELKLKKARGVDPLLDLFDKNGVSDRIDPLRPSVVKGAT